MFAPRFNGTKLKVHLKLCTTRLQMLQKKKENQGVVARKEIAKLLERDKGELARIRVEQIIREDYIIETLEILELYCSLLVSRFGLIESVKTCDPGLREAVATLIWVTPHLQGEVTELKAIAGSLQARYGKEFVQECLHNKPKHGEVGPGWVSERVIVKMTTYQPKPELVDGYLVTIAQAHGVNYMPPVRLDEADLLGGPGAAPGAPTLFDFPSPPKPGDAAQPTVEAGMAPGDLIGDAKIDDLFPAPPGPGGSGTYPPPQAGPGLPPVGGGGHYEDAATNPSMAGSSQAAPPPVFDAAAASGTAAFPPPPTQANTKGAMYPPRNESAPPPFAEFDAKFPMESTFPMRQGPEYAAAPTPAVPTPSAPPPPAAAGTANEPDLPDFDELTRRFRNLKEKQAGGPGSGI